MTTVPLCACLAAGVLLLGGIGGARAATTDALYVSPQGDDAWSGRLPEPNAAATDGPFATLKAARDAIRHIKARDGSLSGPLTVYLRGGTYELEAPFTLSPQDSGTIGCPIIYSAYAGEKPVLSGGVAIKAWQKAKGGVWTTHLPEVQQGRWYFRQLFVKHAGNSYSERRYRPCLGAFTVAGLTNAPAREGIAHRRSQDEFRFTSGDIRPWDNRDDVEIVALHDWSASRLRIRELDLEGHIVRFTSFPVYRIGHWWAHGRNPYFVENVKEALDRPGEWYLDRATGMLSYIPMPDENMAHLTVIAPRAEQLVRLTGDDQLGSYVEQVQFKGITFAHTHWTLPQEGYSSGQGMTDLPAAVQVHSGRHIRIEGCTLAHLGAYAIELGGGCSNNEVVGNHMFDLGGGGVKVGGAGPVPANNLVANNVISDGGLIHLSAHGIWAGITRHTVISHNVVRRFPYSNISVGWSWNDKPTAARDNVVEANHIHDSMMLLADGGGLYTLGFQPGTIIRGNYIHDVHRSKFAGRAPNNGFFFDQGSKGFLIDNNVICTTSGAPVRHNQNQPDWHTWETNHFGVSPDGPAFPLEIVKSAGLESAYRHLDEERVPIAPTPILTMELPPPPPPSPIVDDFESETTGAGPQERHVQGADENVHIRPTGETAAKGQGSLKFTDGPLAKKPFYPYLIYQPRFTEGRVTVSLHLRVENGASVWIDTRTTTTGGTFHSGPSLKVDAEGALLAGEKALARVPVGQWFGVEMKFSLGDRAADGFDVVLSLPGEEPMSLPGLPVSNRGFTRLDWVGIIAAGTQQAVFYVDQVRILNE